jgi:hypothetical protein
MSSTKKRLQLAGALAALATLALAVSCRGFFPPEQLASMTISPSTPTVPLGGSTQLSVFGTNTDGSTAGNISGKVTWTSSAATITVTAGGLLKGNDLSATPATITALYQSVTATASATVCVESGSNFMITLNPTQVTHGQPESMTATATVSGIPTPVDITSGVTWSTNNSGVTVSGGDPASVDTTQVTTVPVTVTIFGAYSCNGLTSNFQTNLQVN